MVNILAMLVSFMTRCDKTPKTRQKSSERISSPEPLRSSLAANSNLSLPGVGEDARVAEAWRAAHLLWELGWGL